MKRKVMSGNSTEDTPTPQNGAPGRWFQVVIWLTAIMTYRLVVAGGFADLGEGTPEFWVVALTGDTFMGLTAPIVAYLLWKNRGLAIWTTAIVWYAIGIKDYLAGLMFAGIELPDGTSAGMLVPILIVGIGFHVLCIYLLARHRRHYLEV